jgi:hypothetical protein
MSATPRRRRGSGSLGQLKARLWACIEYNVTCIEDENLEHDLRQRACNSLTQAALAYSRVVELHDLQRDMQRFEHLAHGNGHGPQAA